MNIDKFRIEHSILIEHYQFIEHHLEGIYAHISGKPFVCGLAHVEESAIGKILFEIKNIEKHQNVSIISIELYNRLQQVLDRRNYWCHNCYVDMTFTLKGDIKNESCTKKIKSDLKEAEDLRETLFKIKDSLKAKKVLNGV